LNRSLSRNPEAESGRMKIWRKKTIRWERKGERVSRETPGARKRIELSKRFYGTLRESDERSRQVPLSEDREASEAILRTLQTTEDRERALGITPREKEQGRPLAEHVAEYLAHLRTKRTTPKYIELFSSSIEAVIAACRRNLLSEYIPSSTNARC
jgi:hypothetical protein